MGEVGACGRSLWARLALSISRAILNPRGADMNDFVLTVLFCGGVFYLFLFVAGVMRPQGGACRPRSGGTRSARSGSVHLRSDIPPPINLRETNR